MINLYIYKNINELFFQNSFTKINYDIAYFDPLIYPSLKNIADQYNLKHNKYKYEFILTISNHDYIEFNFYEHEDNIIATSNSIDYLKELMDTYKNKTQKICIENINKINNKYEYIEHYLPYIKIKEGKIRYVSLLNHH